jgi:hypothetical protein
MNQAPLEDELFAAICARRQMPFDEKPVRRFKLPCRIPWQKHLGFIVRLRV